VGSMLENAIFDLEPIVRDDMWDEFQRAAVRKVSIAIASPGHLDRVDRGPAAAAVTSIKNMAEAYEAPKIDIVISMGTRKGSLGDQIKGVVGHFRGLLVRGQEDVTKMKARIKLDDERPEDIDLLQDILSVSNELDLPDNNPDLSYTIKQGALTAAMHEWIG
jgi:hypothetical protein